MISPLSIAIGAAAVLLGAALFLATWRVLRGPSTADRVIALDLAGNVLVGLIAVRTIYSGEEHLIPSAMVLALLAFLSTIVIARFLERTRTPRAWERGP